MNKVMQTFLECPGHPLLCWSPPSAVLAEATEWFSRLMQCGQAHCLPGSMCETAQDTTPPLRPPPGSLWTLILLATWSLFLQVHPKLSCLMSYKPSCYRKFDSSPVPSPLSDESFPFLPSDLREQLSEFYRPLSSPGCRSP